MASHALLPGYTRLPASYSCLTQHAPAPVGAVLWFYDLKEPVTIEYHLHATADLKERLASECRTDLCTVPGLVAVGLLFPPFLLLCHSW